VNRHRLPGWRPLAIAIAVLLAVLLVLLSGARSFAESHYFEDVAELRQLKRLDAQWELEVLRSRSGITGHYDALANSRSELGRLFEALDADLASEEHELADELTKGRQELRAAIEEKATLIERFKSSNSVLRNSLVFLPIAAEELQRASSHGRGRADSAAASVPATVSRLLLSTMLYSQNASDERAAEIAAGLGRLEAQLRAHPVTAREAFDVFAVHVRTVLREQMVVAEILGAIAAAPTAISIDRLDRLLGVEEGHWTARNENYHRYLLVFSAILVALLIYAAAHLVRTRALIDRVNRELLGANENLEQRVLERTNELRQTQSELVTAARRAGMAEIAVNVLHNVGNVLNSVNISADLVTTRLRASKVDGLSRAVRLMDEHAGDLGGFLTQDAKGLLLPGYLRDLAEVLEAEREAMVEELGALGKSVEHIKEIIAAQQSHAGTARMAKFSKLGELVDEALRMNVGALTGREVAVVTDLAGLPALPLDRQRVLQILVNLIGNARQAMSGLVDRNPSMTIGGVLIDGNILRVTVADNGVGIAPENLRRLFSHGFTTRKDGHGFGLHSCALAARGMGGSLTAHSNGSGLGAAFTLRIPVGPAEAR
jgi:two-component system, NtrC family, sensor kinase